MTVPTGRQGSIFSYPVTRPYPWFWFTWSVVTGFSVLGVLFSFVAVAGNAYQFQSVYTTDPNGTESHREWFQRAPFSWLAAMESKCQAAQLTVGGQYFTTNRGFVYTLDSIRRESLVANEALSSEPYRNATLVDCDVAEIRINMLRVDDTRMSQRFWTWGASNSQATTTCALQSDEGITRANFTATLPSIKDQKLIIQNFLVQNATTNAGMYYGVRLLNSWYGKLAAVMGWQEPGGVEGAASYGSGTIDLVRNTNVTDYTAADFWLCDATFSDNGRDLTFQHFPATIKDWANQWTTDDPDKRYNLPNISTTVDAFGKTFYSLLLSDFGVDMDSNALLTVKGVEYLQSINDTDAAEMAAGSESNLGVVTHVVDPEHDGAQYLGTTKAATISTQYLCSVPKQKGGFSLFFGVLLADIVFLNTAWKLFTWIVTWWLGKKDPLMNHCVGCMQRQEVVLIEQDSASRVYGNAGSHDYLPVESGTLGDHRSTTSDCLLIHESSNGNL